MIKSVRKFNYVVNPYGTEEVLFGESASVPPLLVIDYGDEVQNAEFTYRPTKGSFDANINNVAVIRSIKGNTSVINGELVNCKMVGIQTIGFNQWDEVWEAGRYNSNGTKASANDSIRCVNFVHVLSNKTYYPKFGTQTSSFNWRILYYDKNKQLIESVVLLCAKPFITPEGCCYIKFSTNTSYGGTYNNNICMNISDTTKNGQYKAYKQNLCNIPIVSLKGKLNGQSSSTVIFSDGIKSAGSVRDEIKVESNVLKAFKRVGTRVYENGDVNGDAMTTDGVNYTNYALETIEEYIIDDVNIEKVMLGNTEITKVYLGNQLIFKNNN